MRQASWRSSRLLVFLIMGFWASVAGGQTLTILPADEVEPGRIHILTPADEDPTAAYSAQINWAVPAKNASQWTPVEVPTDVEQQAESVAGPVVDAMAVPAETALISPIIEGESAITGCGCGNLSCGVDGHCSCGQRGCCGDGCSPFWTHRSLIFGDLLFLQAGNVDLPFALPIDGPGAGAVPVGPVAVADPDYETWFRTGLAIELSPTSSMGLSYTHYESGTDSAIAINGPNVVLPLIVDPAAVNALAFGQSAAARYDIDFQFIDVELKQLWSGSSRHAVNYTVGARYGHMDQDFRAVFAGQPGFTAVDTRIGFDGGGPRFGLTGERLLGGSRFSIYGNAAASFLAGQYRASFVQTNAFAGVQAVTSWKDDRIVPILDGEVGVGWLSANGRMRLAGGYTIAGWFNSLTTAAVIDAEQSFGFAGLRDTITFDGLVARIELRR